MFVLPIRSGRVGNNLFQLSFAFYITSLLGNAKLVNFGIPEIGIQEDERYEFLVGEKSKTIDLSELEISQMLEKGTFGEFLRNFKGSELIKVRGLGKHPRIYLQSQEYLKSLVSHAVLPNTTNKDELVIHIRAGDLWRKFWQFKTARVHPDYSALPLDFYRLVMASRSRSVLMVCEPGIPRWYLNKLRNLIPGVEFKVQQSSIYMDFQTILNAREVCLSISTFSWMAAFLGKSKIVHFPLRGLFDINQRPDLDLRSLGRGKIINYYSIDAFRWRGYPNSCIDRQNILSKKARITDTLSL